MGDRLGRSLGAFDGVLDSPSHLGSLGEQGALSLLKLLSCRGIVAVEAFCVLQDLERSLAALAHSLHLLSQRTFWQRRGQG